MNYEYEDMLPRWPT